MFLELNRYYGLEAWFNPRPKYVIDFVDFQAKIAKFLIFELKGKGPSQAEVKILQLELWLEPAQLGPITTRHLWLDYFKKLKI